MTNLELTIKNRDLAIQVKEWRLRYEGLRRKYELPPLENETHIEKIRECAEAIFTLINQDPDIKFEDIIRKTRLHKFKELRHVVVYFLRHNFRFTVVAIGKAILRDHSTICNSIQVVNDWAATDKQYRAELEIMAQEIKRVIK